LLALLLGAALFPLLAPAAPVPKHLMKDRPPNYYPTTVGATWVYTFAGREETRFISKVEEVNGAKLVTVEQERGVWEKMSVSANGLARVQIFATALDPPLIMLQAPFRVGHSWEDKTAGILGTKTISAIEQVKVPAGTFEAVRVDAAYTLVGMKNNDSFWYAPGVGLVKMVYGGGQECVLKSFTPGKE
jgi:hypothetical protein